MHKNILITGGAGFIGSNFVNLAKTAFETIVVLDACTYAAVNAPLELQFNSYCCINDVHYYRGNITNTELVRVLLEQYNIDVVVNFAAETHVDNSIADRCKFIDTNINGVNALLETCCTSWSNEFATKRFIQVSTDEVFGQLMADQKSFTENSPYKPRNPYAASKAAGDHLVEAYYNTFNFPAIITHCCNNYGRGQHPEKMIPKSISNIINCNKVPIYGTGQQIREWIHVIDHCRGILACIQHGQPGEHYNFGSGVELSNNELLYVICSKMGVDFKTNTTYVSDRKGHDFRYSINSDKAKTNLNWQPLISFDEGITDTIEFGRQNI